jgi:hypothetical protein
MPTAALRRCAEHGNTQTTIRAVDIVIHTDIHTITTTDVHPAATTTTDTDRSRRTDPPTARRVGSCDLG